MDLLLEPIVGNLKHERIKVLCDALKVNTTLTRLNLRSE